jgi:hypothetical protein
MNEKKIMRRAAGATPDANGRPNDFDHFARRKRTRRRTAALMPVRVGPALRVGLVRDAEVTRAPARFFVCRLLLCHAHGPIAGGLWAVTDRDCR